MHDCEDLIRLFNACFMNEYSTRLVRGGEEPIYLPAQGQNAYHEIHFAHGFFSSALHECAHWLLAGEARRRLVDFGYWYIPDGRTQAEQIKFQEVEVKPQALEWILSVAAKFSFCLSVDNLEGETTDSTAFKEAVYAQVRDYCERGLSIRARRFRQAICEFYGQSTDLCIQDFDLARC